MAAIPIGTAVGYLTLDYSQFSKNLKSALGEATSMSGKFSDTLGTGLKTIGESISSVGRTLTTGISLPLATAGASAIKFGAEFDKQMSAVKAVTGATTEEFNNMRTAAIEWGGKTVYTATEAGQALYYMGLAGWDAEKSINALGPVLNLASAGNLELGRTSDIVTDAMTAMGLEAGKTTDGIENTTHFTNVLATTMSNANTDVDQLGEAFRYVAPVAGALGFSIDDLALALGLMANVGVKASQAGTGLRQALSQLTNPTDKAKEIMKEFNVSLYDSEGNAKSLRQFMEELRTTFGDLEVDIYNANGEVMEGEELMEKYGNSLPISQQEKLNALVNIFGVRALPGIVGIINQSDDAFNGLASAIEGADTAFGGLGSAVGMAETQMDNLYGDWVKFTSALGTAKIAITDIVGNSLRSLLQSLTDLVNKFNSMDKSQQETILKFAALAASIGPVLFIFGKLVSFVGSVITGFHSINKAITLVRTGFTMASSSIKPLLTALSSISPVVLLVVAVIAMLIAAFKDLWKNNEEFRNNIKSMWNDIKSSFSKAGQAIINLLNELGFNFEDFEQIVSAVISEIKRAWSAFCQFIGPVFIQVFHSIKSIIVGLVETFTGVINTITGLIKGLKTGDWTLFFEGLKQTAQGFITFIIAGLSKVPETIYNMIKAVANYWGVNWTETWEEAKQKVTNFVKNVLVKLGELPVNIVLLLGYIVTSVNKFFIKIIQKALTGAVQFVTNIMNEFLQLPGKIQNIINNVISGILNFLSQIISLAIQIGVGFLTNIINNIINLPNKIQTIISNVISKVTTFKSNMINMATSTGKGFLNGIINIVKQLASSFNTHLSNTINKVNTFKSNLIHKAQTAAKGFLNSIINGTKTIPAQMVSIGANIVNGVWKGILGAKASFEANVKSFFSNIVRSAKSALGIKSPSKVFADEVGKFIPPGISEGFEEALPDAMDDIQDGLDKGVDNLSTDDKDVNISVLGFVNEFQNVVNDVTVWFESIEERLAKVISGMKQDITSMVNLGNLVLTTTDGMLYNTLGIVSGKNQNNEYAYDIQNIIELLKVIIDKVDGPPKDLVQSGDIIIPVSIGGEEVDTIVVSAQTRNDYRSGGR